MEKMDTTEIRGRNPSVNGPEFLISDIDNMQVAFIIERNPPLIYVVTGNAAHSHSSFELQFISENTFDELIDNKRNITISEGDLMLIPPHMLHKTLTQHQFGKYCINFFICPPSSETPNTNRENSIETLFAQIDHEIVFRNSEINHCFQKIFDPELNDPLSISRIQLHLTLIFMEIATHLNTVFPQHFEPKSSLSTQHQIDANRKWLIEAYLAHYYMHKNHVENLSRILNLSPRQTNRVVKTLTGYNLQDLILRHRMSIAVEQIKYTELSLGQIAEFLGYSTYSGFYTAFSKYHGVSPEKLRESL